MALLLQVFIICAPDGGELSASLPGRLTPQRICLSPFRYPLDSRLSGPHSRSGHFGDDKNSFYPVAVAVPMNYAPYGHAICMSIFKIISETSSLYRYHLTTIIYSQTCLFISYFPQFSLLFCVIFVMCKAGTR